MIVSREVAAAVRELVESRAARPIALDDFTSNVALGADGLGLDSIAIAEVLLQCEERFGVEAATLLERQPLGLGDLAHSLGDAAG
jgi:acyl carrier protein